MSDIPVLFIGSGFLLANLGAGWWSIVGAFVLCLLWIGIKGWAKS